MFKCWKDSSRDAMLVGLISFIAVFWSLLREAEWLRLKQVPN